MNEEWLNLDEFGKFIGRDRTSVGRAIKLGKIPQEKVKKIKGQRYVHVSATAEYNNRHQMQSHIPKIKNVVDLDRVIESQETEIKTTNTRKVKVPDYTESRQIFEAYRARLAQLEYNERSGKMVDKENIINAYANIWSGVRSSMMGMAGRISIELENKTAHDIEHLILEELEKIFEEIRNWTPNQFSA